ncbi:MAG: hypothetical protein ABJC12_10740 [Saprospiraceae bacterium]
MSFGLLVRFLFIAGLMALACHPGVAQRVIVNGNGERMIMYPDGSWRMAEAGDSVLLRQNLQKSEMVNYPSDKIDATINRNPGEEDEYTLRQWNELYFRIKENEKKTQTLFRNATNAQFNASEMLQNAEANKSMIETDRLATLEDNYVKSVQKLRQAKLQQKEILKLSDQAKKISDKPAKTIKKKLPQISAQFENYLNTFDPQHNIRDLSKPKIHINQNQSVDISTKSEKTPNTHSKQKDLSAESGNKEQFSKSKDVHTSASGVDKLSYARTTSLRLPSELIPKAYKSEPYSCKVITDTIDAITRTRRIALAPDLIFTNTDPDLRPYFKSKELITCNGRLLKIGPYIYFNIDFQIASSHSQGNFGSLEAGSLLRLRLLDGKYVLLYNLKGDRGRIDPYSGNTIFTGQFALGKDETKILTSSPLDKIRILWSTGFEDYDVYKIDFFINQISCLLTR